MTYPITPNPAIHNPSPSASANRAQLNDAAVQQLRQVFFRLPKIILEAVVAFIKQTTGIDLSGFLPLLDGLGNVVGLGNSTGVLNFFNIIPQILGGLNLADPIHTAVDVVTKFASTMLDPLGFFANLVGGVVPNHQSPATVGVAQYAADTANSGVAILNAKVSAPPSGLTFTDTFNRAVTTNLGTDYDRVMGSGPGTWGTDGLGNAVWMVSGFGSQLCLDRVIYPMTTKYQSISTVMTAPPAGAFTGNSQTKLCLRMNTAKTTYVVATIDCGFVEIGYVLAGAYTRLGSTVPLTQSSGDLYEFRAGTVTNDYEFVLLQNGLTVCNRFDTGHASQVGVGTYDYGGVIAVAGVTFFFIFLQMPAPTLQVLTVADRTP